MTIDKLTDNQLEALSTGVHVKCFVEHLEGSNDEVARLTVLVYPLPADITEELAAKIQSTVNSLLAEKQLVSGEMTDIAKVQLQ